MNGLGECMAGAMGSLILESPQMAALSLVLAAAALAALVVLYGPQSRGLGWGWRTLLWMLRGGALLALVGSVLKPAVLRERQVGEDSAAVVVLIDTSRSMLVRDYAAATTRPMSSASDAATRPAAGKPSGDVEQTLVALADGLGKLPAGKRSGRMAGLDNEVGHVLGLMDELRQVRSELDYARLSGRGVDLAEGRVTLAIAAVVSGAKHLSDSTAGIELGATALKAAVAKLVTACQGLSAARGGGQDLRTAQGLAQAARDALNREQSEEDRRLYETDQTVQSVCDDIARETRLGLVEDAIATPDTGLLWRLPSGVPVFAFTIGSTVRSIPVASGEESDSLKDLRPVGVLDLPADGTRSELSDAVTAALSRLSGVPVAAVVMFSDGREVTQGAATSVTSAAGTGAAGSDVPVFAVLSGPLAGPLCDIAVTRLTVPASAYVGQTMHVHAVLTQVGALGRPVEVRLDVDGEATQFREMTLGEAPADLDFQVKVEHAGVTKVSVSAPAFGDEATTDNNRAVAWTKVQAGPLRVALLTSTANWDEQYLHNALARQPWVKLTEGMAQDAGSRVLVPAAELARQDVVILDDLAVDALDEGQWQAVENVALRQGGGVVMIAGDGHLPAEYSTRPELAQMLPYKTGAVALFRNWPGAAAHYHLLPAGGLSDPAVLEALRLDDDGDIAGSWGELPALFRYLAIPAPRTGARALLVERDSNSPVLVEQGLGAGRTILCGIDQTWRWRYKVGETDQDRFWLQLVGYAAGEAYATRTESAWLDAEPVAPEPGQAVHVRVKLPEADAAAPTVELWNGNEHVADRVLSRDVGAGEFSGSITPPALPSPEDNGGDEVDYALRVKGADAAMAVHVGRNYQDELANLSASDQPMRHIAESSGGALLTLDQVSSLPQRIESARGRAAKFVEVRLWDSAYLYVFVLACLSGEWAIRKIVGLV